MENIKFLLLVFTMSLFCQINDSAPTNAEVLQTLKDTQMRNQFAGDNTPTIEKIPTFDNKRDEIMWKLNYAKKTIKKAEQIEHLAKRAAVHFGYFDGTKQEHGEVKDLLTHADDVLMNAGEKMGFEYEKY